MSSPVLSNILFYEKLSKIKMFKIQNQNKTLQLHVIATYRQILVTFVSCSFKAFIVREIYHRNTYFNMVYINICMKDSSFIIILLQQQAIIKIAEQKQNI